MLVDERVETPQEIAKIVRARDDLKMQNAILLTVPVPPEFEISLEKLESNFALRISRS